MDVILWIGLFKLQTLLSSEEKQCRKKISSRGGIMITSRDL